MYHFRVHWFILSAAHLMHRRFWSLSFLIRSLMCFKLCSWITDFIFIKNKCTRYMTCYALASLFITSPYLPPPKVKGWSCFCPCVMSHWTDLINLSESVTECTSTTNLTFGVNQIWLPQLILANNYVCILQMLS